MADSDCIIVHEQVVVPDAVVVEEMVALPGEKGDKGDPFTYDDFTPEQIEELQRPATKAAAVAIASAQRAESAAESVQGAVEDAEQASQSAQQAATAAVEAVANANTAVESVNALEERVEQAEATRVQSEAQRQTAETNRASSEQRREVNDTERQQKFAQIESDINSLKDSLNEAEQQRVESESARKTAEAKRETAEQQRVTEFSQIKSEAENLISQTTEAKNAATEAATSATNAAEEANTAAQSANDAAENANQAAQNVDGRVTSLEEKASQVYDNFAAIEASGETNPNKIYIDGETAQPYIYKGGEFVPFKGGTDAYTENGFYISPYYLEATDLRYIGFKDIANDTTCYILTAGRCLKFDLNTYEVFWDVKLQGYGASWHNAAEQLRIIDDIVYIVCAYWNDNDKGIHLLKLNDTDGSFISDELIPIPARYVYSPFKNRPVLITKDYIVGIDFTNQNMLKCNLQDNSTEVISTCLQNGVLGNRWITTPNGDIKYSIAWLSEKNVIKVLDEDFNLYTINLIYKNSISSNLNTCLYDIDFKLKVLHFSYLSEWCGGTMTNEGNYDVNVNVKNTFVGFNYNHEYYSNNILNPNFATSNQLQDVRSLGLLFTLTNKDTLFLSNITGLMLASNLCASAIGYRFEIEKINVNFT